MSPPDSNSPPDVDFSLPKRRRRGGDRDGWHMRVWYGPRYRYSFSAAVLSAVVAVVVAGARVVAFRRSELIHSAVAKAERNPLASKALGRPLSGSPWYSGHLDGSRADLEFDVEGPSGSGRLQLKATDAAGSVQYDRLYLITEAGRGIDLIGPNLVR